MKKSRFTLFRGDRAAAGLAVLAAILVTGLALAPPALAQFVTDPPAAVYDSPAGADPSAAADATAVPDAGDATPPAVADPPADVPTDGAAPMAAAPGSSAASDDSAAEHSGWVRSDDDADSGNPTDKVLEVPQVVDPADGKSPAGSGQTAQGGGASSPDQVGSVNDYQDEDDDDGGMGGVYIPRSGASPFGAGSFRANSGTSLNPALGKGLIPSGPLGANFLGAGTNGMNSAIGTTSPMFPGPRTTTPIAGGWWNRP